MDDLFEHPKNHSLHKLTNLPTLKIPQHILDEMVAHARELDPHECCGLLAGKDGRVTRHYKITNTVAKNAQAEEVFDQANVKQLRHLPQTTRAEVAYFMDPNELFAAFKDMRKQDIELAVIYHSHTHSPAYPSQTDVGLAMYPDSLYIIVSLQNKTNPDIRAFWIKAQQVTAAEIISV